MFKLTDVQKEYIADELSPQIEAFHKLTREEGGITPKQDEESAIKADIIGLLGHLTEDGDRSGWGRVNLKLDIFEDGSGFAIVVDYYVATIYSNPGVEVRV